LTETHRFPILSLRKSKPFQKLFGSNSPAAFSRARPVARERPDISDFREVKRSGSGGFQDEALKDVVTGREGVEYSGRFDSGNTPRLLNREPGQPAGSAENRFCRIPRDEWVVA